MNSFRAPDLQCFSALKLRSYQPPNLSSSKATTANIFPVKAAAESSYHQANKSMEIKKSWFEAVRESVNNLAKGRLRLRYCCGLIAAALLPSVMPIVLSIYKHHQMHWLLCKMCQQQLAQWATKVQKKNCTVLVVYNLFHWLDCNCWMNNMYNISWIL